MSVLLYAAIAVLCAVGIGLLCVALWSRTSLSMSRRTGPMISTRSLDQPSTSAGPESLHVHETTRLLC